MEKKANEIEKTFQLSAEEKLAIIDYVQKFMFKWLGILGIPSVLVLIGGLIYIAFVLPDKALIEASKRVEKDIGQFTEVARTKVDSITDELNVQYGKAQQMNESLEKATNKLSEQIKDLENKMGSINSDVDIIRRSDLNKIAENLRVLSQYKNISDVIRQIGEIDNQLKLLTKNGERLNIAAGYSIPGQTAWKQYTDAKGQMHDKAIYVDIDTSFARFENPPLYFTSMGGESGHWIADGVTSLYEITEKSFRIYLQLKVPITPKIANEKKWHIQWIAIGK